MYLLIILLPLLGAITSLLLGRFIGKGGPIITILNLICSFILSILLAYEVIFQYSPVYIKLYNYINFELMEINIEFIFDQLSVSMLFIIIFISMLVHIYSFEYMASDPHLPRFMGYLSLFTFMMILLVTSNNYFQLFLGWEGLITSLKWINNQDINLFAFIWQLTLPHSVKLVEGVTDLKKSNIKLKSDQRVGPHNIDVLYLIYGSLLGDSHLEKEKKV